MNNLIQNFNSGNYKGIYDNFSTSLKEQISLIQWQAGMIGLKNQGGNMMNATYLAPLNSNPQCQDFISAYTKDLALGTTVICLNSQYEIFNITVQINPFSFYKYILDNPSDNVGLQLIVNNTILTQWNENQNFSQMSTFKMSVVLEYGRQMSLGLINNNQTFTLDEINTYYLVGIDNSHQDWLNLMNATGNIVNNSIQLYQIAWGMVYYSSNCNTEFLQTLLGLDNITLTLQTYNISMNANCYCASAILALKNDLDLPYNFWIDYLRGISHNELVQRANYYHKQLQTNPKLRFNNSQWFLDPKVMDILTNIFQMTSPSSWNRLNQLINKQIFFDAKWQVAMEYVMSVTLTGYGNSLPFYRSHYRSGGIKGGGNAYPGMNNTVIAITYFERDLWNNELSMFWVFNQITFQEYEYRYYDMNNFDNSITFNPQFRDEFVKRVNQLKNQKSMEKNTF